MEIKNDFIRCPACRGAKEVMQLGAIMKNCRTCKGVGKIKNEPKSINKCLEAESKDMSEISKLSISEEEKVKKNKRSFHDGKNKIDRN